MRDHDDSEPAPGCPTWCRAVHHDRLHPDDQHHQSAVRRVGVVTGRPTLEPDDLAVPSAVLARLVRRTDSVQTWVELISDEGRDVRLVVTLESAERLRAVLDGLVATATDP
jgi:hypothetical protein